MNKLKIYCVTDKRLPFLEHSIYELCAVGKHFSSKNYLNANTKKNIFDKEKYYSELTFHYWYWQNLMNLHQDEWVGFCQKRRFWIKKTSVNEKISKENLTEHMLTETEKSWNNFEALICEPIKVSGAKKIKIIKRGWRNVLKDPSLLFDENKQSIKLHFDMHHGYGKLDKAIDLLDESQRYRFKKYVISNNSYNPHIMVISKPKILDKWFTDLFKWLSDCEKTFGFNDLSGYDSQRLYAYLAERYLSFWFKDKTKYLEWPWKFVDN